VWAEKRPAGEEYVKKLNEAVKDHAKVAAMPLEEILAKLPELPEDIRTAVRNNGGGHANHSMFWQVMGKAGGAPDGDLKTAIDSDLGGLDKLKEDFNDKGGKVFGSGWVFVAVTPEGKLSLVSKPNQDTPLMEGGRVLFGNDVWEHAYYLKYQNRRPESQGVVGCHQLEGGWRALRRRQGRRVDDLTAAAVTYVIPAKAGIHATRRVRTPQRGRSASTNYRRVALAESGVDPGLSRDDGH
jgi:superoxide dismutase